MFNVKEEIPCIMQYIPVTISTFIKGFMMVNRDETCSCEYND